MTVPLISVLIDTHNHESYIEQTILSAIEQDVSAGDYEILAVDDGSTDSTPEIIRKFSSRVRLLRKANGGQASAFNAGVPECRGQFIAFLDGDDWFAPGKLATVTTTLERHPEAAAIGHGHYEFREKTETVTVYTPLSANFASLATLESARDAQGAWRSLLMGALTIRKDVVERVLPIPEELTFCADTPIQMAALAHGAIVLREPLFYYRRHETNLYSNAAYSENVLGLRRKLSVHRLALEEGLRVLVAEGVPLESARQLIWPTLVEDNRSALSTFGGSRRDALRTELRSFHVNNRNSGLSRRVFTYAILGGATLLMPPRAFYKVRDWYSKAWYYLLDLTYSARHAIGLNRRRTEESSAKTTN